MAVWVQLENFVFRCEKTNGRLGTRIKLQILYFVQKTNGNLDATLDFIICCQKAN